MREINVGIGAKANVRLFDYLAGTFSAMPTNALHRAFRKKDVKVDGRWAPADAPLTPGSAVRLYLPDEVLFGCPLPGAPIVYEDARLLVVDKPQGMPVHPDRHGSGATLVELAREYLMDREGNRPGTRPRGSPTSRDSVSRSPASRSPASGTGGSHGGSANGCGGATHGGAFQPSLCHRLDRNTGGIVAIAKDAATLRFMLDMFENGGAAKTYRCMAHGKPEPAEGMLDGWLAKDARRGFVRVSSELGGGFGGKHGGAHSGEPGMQRIRTCYRLLRYDPAADTSIIDVAPLTGRTHQIRAQLAAAGHPIIGDGKYCPGEINKAHRACRQMLWAYILELAAGPPPYTAEPMLGAHGLAAPPRDSVSRDGVSRSSMSRDSVSRDGVSRENQPPTYLYGARFEIELPPDLSV